VDLKTKYSSIYEALLESQPLAHPCRNLNAYLNSIFFSPAVAMQISNAVFGGNNNLTFNNLLLTHYLISYLRNFLGGILVYYGTAGTFHYFCYVHPMSEATFGGGPLKKQRRKRPTAATMWDQVQLAQTSLTLYVMLPCLDEFFIEQGWTAVYYTVSEVGGWFWYGLYLCLYMAMVEVGIYWMHRTLHTNKWLYKHVHMLHHKYNRPESLTPWASIAFHPLDGILQASPYLVAAFFVPCHYVTHLALLFFTAIWATYIHDAMDWNIDPIMGSKYHTVHHTHYIYNYGQIFTWCDAFWGTLKVPDGPTGVTIRKEN
jgi:Delta7-sterol 5-desaturase